MRNHLRLKNILMILISLLLVTACNQDGEDNSETTEPAEVNQSAVQYIPFVDDALGLTAQYPANWMVNATSSGATFATDQAVIDAESLAEIGENGFIVVIPGEIDYFNFQTGQTFSQEDILSALATYKILLEREGQQYVTVEPPQAFTNNNQKMARMVLRSIEDGEPLITVMSVVMGDTHMALISAASLEETSDDMRPIFYKVIDSIEVKAPGSFSTENE